MSERKELFRGKTKAVFADQPGLAVFKSLDAITKFDDPSQTKQMEGKAAYATRTTCNVFSILKAAGIPVAFREQLSDTEFLAELCQMIPLEVIARRYAVGSYLNRFPHLKTEEGKRPNRFHRLVFELFLKTTGRAIKDFEGKVIGETSVEDPLIESDETGSWWKLRHPKFPYWDQNSDLITSLDPGEFFPEGKSAELIAEIEQITRKTFLVLEGAWAQLGFRLIDFKIEFGINQEGKLVVADVIDNDSWRLRTSSWEEVSKQCFRDNAGMDEIGSKYAMVAKLTDNFRLPQQCIVTWRGSKDDLKLEVKDFFNLGSSIFVHDVILSGHKSPNLCLKSLENVLSTSPEGGVIIAMVGMSNGLGPMLAARTSWPVITIPLTVEENALDVWSSLSVPSQVPLLTVMSKKNAVLATLNVLAQKNPYAYMLRQYEIEKFDV
jgi:phosphoribosylaminoimidazole carboxylase/phosphoribosylaminoimidazole-succinocarboxamide synthase